MRGVGAQNRASHPGRFEGVYASMVGGANLLIAGLEAADVKMDPEAERNSVWLSTTELTEDATELTIAGTPLTSKDALMLNSSGL